MTNMLGRVDYVWVLIIGVVVLTTAPLCCQCQHQDNSALDDNDDGYSNDSPYIIEPEIPVLRVKTGTQLTLKCIDNNQHHHYRGITWEFKHCETNYKGVMCDTKDVNDIVLSTTAVKQVNNSQWTILSHNRGRINIEYSNKNHNGVYRCIEKGVVKKRLIVDVVGVNNYDGPPPKVATLITSNITNQLNMEFTIQCNITSIIPPTIIWFKKCYGMKCDIDYSDICYCHLNLSTSMYSIGNTYLSKINILNARNIDSGLYACLAVTEYGKDYKNVTILVPDNKFTDDNRTFSLLFLIPVTLIFVPVTIWLCYYNKRKKETVTVVIDQRNQLIKPVVVRVADEFSEIL